MHIERHASRAAFILVASNIEVNNNAKTFEQIQKNIIVRYDIANNLYSIFLLQITPSIKYQSISIIYEHQIKIAE